MSRRVGRVPAVSRRRLGVTLDEFTVETARGAAERAGLSLSPWLAHTVRQEAVRQGAGTAWGDHEAETEAEDAACASPTSRG